MKKAISLVVVFVFSGCAVSYDDVRSAYGTAKVIYKDTRYVVYELNTEKKRVDDKGFGVAIDSQQTELSSDVYGED